MNRTIDVVDTAMPGSPYESLPAMVKKDLV